MRPVGNDLTPPDPDIVLDLLQGFRASKAMFAACSLGIFDALAAGAKTLPDLAREISANVDSLQRLLDACVGLGLLERDATGYRNSPCAAAYLCQGSPRRLTGYIRYSNDALWQLWSHLEDAVREGGHRWKQAFGWDGPIFSHFFRDESAKREFLMGMHGYGLISSPHVVAAFDLSRFRRLVDLGGATGHLAITACQRYSQLRATVFDLPEAVPLAREIVAASPVADRVQVVPGDFFADPLPDCDLFALGRILHDWSEDKIIRLLTKIHGTLPADGGVLIAEKVLNDDKDGPRWAVLQNLNMLTCTEGKERTLGEYEGLLQRVGFTEVRGYRTSSPLDAVLAIKQ